MAVITRQTPNISFGSASVFLLIDMTVWFAAHDLFYHVMPLPSGLFRPLQLIFIDTMSVLAGVYLNRYLLGRRNGVQWTQALSVHALSLLAIVFWVYCLKLPSPLSGK